MTNDQILLFALLIIGSVSIGLLIAILIIDKQIANIMKNKSEQIDEYDGNYVISHISNDIFTKGNIYPIIKIYDDTVDILVKFKCISIDKNDKDFSFFIYD